MKWCIRLFCYSACKFCVCIRSYEIVHESFFAWTLLKLTEGFLSLYSNSDRPKSKHGRQADGKLSRGPVLWWRHLQIRKIEVKERRFRHLAFCNAERYCWTRNSQGIQQTSRVSDIWQLKKFLARIIISRQSSTWFTRLNNCAIS